MTAVDEIVECLLTRGAAAYGGERVTQLEHALQCATLSEAAGAEAPLIAAALLHDFGHLIHGLGKSPAARGIDDRHETVGEAALHRWFGENVTEPVRLHVDAKRYLTATDPDYFAGLSPGSVRSLALQGGPFSDDVADWFIALPHASDAVRLRRWDDGAKVCGRPTADLAHFRPYLEASLRRE